MYHVLSVLCILLLLSPSAFAASVGTISVQLQPCAEGQVLKYASGSWACAADETGAGGADASAIHDDETGEIAAIADKLTPVGADHLLIEDSAAANVKKDITIASQETALELVMDLQDMQGAVTDAQVPNTITVDLAATSTALAANGANCAAGQFPLGVNASGAVETCTALPTTISGTANQIAASAATGAITLSIATSPVLPGTTTGTFSGPLTGNVTGTATTATTLTDGDKGDVTVTGGTITLDTNSVGANELDASAVTAELESVLALPNLQGAVTDAQVPDTITIALATQAASLTDGDKGDFTCTTGLCVNDANSVALGTDTTGDYVSGVVASQGLAKTGTEGATLGLVACQNGEILKNVGGTSWACGTDDAGAGGGDATAIHDDAAGEIAAITSKTTPVAADFLLIEDSAAANNKKSITVGSILLQSLGGAVTDGQIPSLIPRKTEQAGDPTVDDDTTLGYTIGYRWINTTDDKEWVALDVTDGAALWDCTTCTVEAQTLQDVFALGNSITTASPSTPLNICNGATCTSFYVDGAGEWQVDLPAGTNPQTKIPTNQAWSLYDVEGASDVLSCDPDATATGNGTCTMRDPLFAKHAVTDKSTAIDYIIGTTDAKEAWGGTIYVTATSIQTLPPVVRGMSVTVIADGAVAVTINPDNADSIIRDGVSAGQTAGVSIVSTSSDADVAVCQYRAANTWWCMTGSNDGDLWTQGS